MSTEDSTDFFGLPPQVPGAPPPRSAQDWPAPNSGAGISDFAGPQLRDRIVVLGRRRAGKTIFLARLYDAAWNGRIADLHMRALPGPNRGHERFMTVIDSLARGQWPEATLGSTTTPIDVEYRGEKTLMVALDYPGEDFRNAFVVGSDEPGAVELRSHVDRAAGVILLLDPDVALAGEMNERVDDDYGMAEAIRRIREQPGGDRVPIAIVLTKCDVHADLVKEAGGLREFTRVHYHNIIRACGGSTRRFSAAAVRVRRDARDKFVPSLRHPPVNVLEPMAYCMERIHRGRYEDRMVEARHTEMRRARMLQEIEEEDAVVRQRNWSIAIGVTVGIGVILVIVNWFIFIRGGR
jgi:hypothetical protein